MQIYPITRQLTALNRGNETLEWGPLPWVSSVSSRVKPTYKWERTKLLNGGLNPWRKDFELNVFLQIYSITGRWSRTTTLSLDRETQHFSDESDRTALGTHSPSITDVVGCKMSQPSWTLLPSRESVDTSKHRLCSKTTNDKPTWRYLTAVYIMGV